MHFGFSYTGVIFLLLLFVPNGLWTKNQPADYECYAKKEPKGLLICERIGQVAVSGLVLIFSDFNVQGWEPWLIWLGLALGLMVVYEVFWLRYFRSNHTMRDFYRSLLGIPVAGATLPVAAFGLLAVYGRNPILGGAVILLGIGHIGIHLHHRKEVYGQQ